MKTDQIKADVVAVNPGSPTIEVFNEATWASISSAPLTMGGFTITGAQAVTWNSDNLLFYAIVTVTPTARHLVTVDPVTGICTNVGVLASTAFSTLTYNSTSGILYTMGGSGGGPVAERLYSVDINTAATTFLAGPYTVGGFGEVIAYNYTDNMIYHWSGTGMEMIDPVTFIATPIVRSGAPVDEVVGAVYVGGGIFQITDLVFTVSTSAFTMTSAGVATLIGPTSYRARGLGYVDPLLPVELSSFSSSTSGSDVTLNWSTSSETNNSGFDIERSSVSGTWSKVGNVTGNGTSITTNNYSYTDKNLTSGNYSYRLKQIDFNGNFEYFNLSNEVIVGIPVKYDLSQNYPNPFNPSTKINYTLPTEGLVSIKIFDMSGKEVMSLVNEVKTAGYYSVNFNASNLSSGIYFYSLSAADFTDTKKMMLVK
ncbi:MAG TPA: T9SS type A sorting domain-containing protein [Ignavibacteria bacterium]|nr:T9SS type A sorting domain-containing protein [Ignavibacteria bacterium]